MAKVEKVLSSLTTRQETEMAFNKIVSMFGDVSTALGQLQADTRKADTRKAAPGNSDSVDLMLEDDPNQGESQTSIY
jgi:hypothetical protein